MVSINIEDLENVEVISQKIKKGAIIPTHIAAQKFNVSTRTVLRWIEENKVKAIKISGRWYVFRDSLKELIEKGVV